MSLWNARAVESDLTEYFACEALGNDAGDCSTDILKLLQSYSIAITINYNSLIIYPVLFLLVFMIDYHSCFRLWNKLLQTTVSSMQDQQTTVSSMQDQQTTVSSMQDQQTTVSSMQDYSSQSPGNRQDFKLSCSPATGEHVQSSHNADISV